MLVIRFLRTGKKHQPFFRIVVTDKKNPPKGGRFLEIVGFFNPLTKEKNIKEERIKYWISVGAQPSDRVHNILVAENIIKGKKISVHAKTKKKEGEEVSGAEVPKSEKDKTKDTEKETPKEEIEKKEEPKKETPKEETPKEESVPKQEKEPSEDKVEDKKESKEKKKPEQKKEETK